MERTANMERTASAGARPVGHPVGFTHHAVAGETQFLIGSLSAEIVGKAVKVEALGAQRPERLIEDEAKKRRAHPQTGAGDGDALEIEVQVQIAEPAQDGEGLDLPRF